MNRLEKCSPEVDSNDNDAQLQTTQDVDQSRLHSVDIADLYVSVCLIHALLHSTPHTVVTGLGSGLTDS